MPPKKNTTRELRLAAVRAGIGKAEPSEVIRDPARDVQDDVMDVDEGEECMPGPGAVPDSEYCNCCGCRAQVLRTCSACRARVCEQPEKNAPGCVHFMSGAVTNFLCPQCARTSLLRKEYGFWGYSGRKHSKMTWPFVFLNIEPLEVGDGCLGRAVELELGSEYAGQPENLLVGNVGLKAGGSQAAASSLRPAVHFVRESSRSGCPANVIAVLQSQSSPVTGAVFYGTQEKKPVFSTIPDILEAFLGSEMKAAMADGNAKALSGMRPEREGWFQEGVSSRGGWRGLIVLAGGPAIRVPARKDEAIGLVERGVYDFVIAFAAQTVVAAHARAFVSSVMRSVGVDNVAEANDPAPPSIWAAVTRAIKSCPVVLESSPIVAIFKERGDGREGQVVCRQVASHLPPFNAWGVQFRSCGNGCDVIASNMAFRPDKGAMRCQCTICGWKSCRVKQQDVADVTSSLCPELPLVFWHAFPPSAHLLDAFGRITKERRE